MNDRAKDMLSIERGAKDLPIDRKKKKKEVQIKLIAERIDCNPDIAICRI